MVFRAPGMAVLAMSLLAGAMPAQLRKPCFVTVVDGDGKPVADAEVVMQWVPDRGSPGQVDVVSATSDARGRCRPELVAGRLYEVWAMGPARADGSHLASEPTDRGACGAVLELAAVHVARPRSLRIEWGEGLDGGKGLELRQCTGPGDARAQVLRVQGDGTYELPPSPWGPTWIVVADAGNVLHAQSIEPEDPSPTVKFVGPSSAHVCVVDTAGKPVVGAGVALTLSQFHRFADSSFPSYASAPMRNVASADVAGNVVLPKHGIADAHAWLEWIRVTAVGFAPEYLPLDLAARSTAANPIRMKLAPSREITGRLRGVRSQESVAALVLATVRKSDSHGSNAIQVPLRVDVAGENVRLDVPGGVSEHFVVIHLLPRSEGTPRFAFLAPEAERLDGLDLDLDKLRTFDLRVVAPDGSAASGAEIVVAPLDNDGSPRTTMLLAGDLSGRATLLVGPGHWAVYTCNGLAHAVEFVHPERAGGQLEIELASIPLLRCRVVGRDGEPVNAARLELDRNQGFDGTLQGPEGIAKETLAAMVALPLALRARSRRDGALEVPIQDWRPWDVSFRIRAGDLTSERLVAKPGRALGDVVVR